MAKKGFPFGPGMGSFPIPDDVFKVMVGSKVANMYQAAVDSKEVKVAFLATLECIARLVESIAKAADEGDDIEGHWDVMTAEGMGDLLAQMSASLYRNGGEGKGGEHDA
ncbi:MAG TPA: hypothetical protein VIY48_21210 [Candidatus Paceibacterota bacterium]